jgi:hypothetical protein
MRNIFSKLATLAFVGVMALGVLPMVPAQAQTPDQIAAAVQAAQGGNSQAIATLLASFPGGAVAIGDAVATALNTSGPGSANLATALVATNNTALIAGVLIANGMSPGAQTVLASAVVASNNPVLIANVQASAQTSGSASALAALAALTASLQANVTLQQQVAAATPITVIVPSPAQAQQGSPS